MAIRAPRWIIVVVLIVLPTVLSGERAVTWEGLVAQVGRLLQEQQYSEAVHTAEEALAIAEQEFGPGHPNVARSLTLLAGLYEFVAAAPLLERSVSILDRTLGPAHPDVAIVLIYLAEVYEKVGRTDEARALRRRAAEIRS